ncbi:hypothetical protein LOK74_21205 [Brevibacillus humidisoli]|uniref:hypothetical protein n=1 Tax=Brevibacillus humidisoli TaxID=2895522 RepID=UPI001E538865|nr:hypothetical protein [Brevibacillus humidisoli]UFJ40512.1 hypothetical protein LOK74_21205 [Brevibacillus humidisoli]
MKEQTIYSYKLLSRFRWRWPGVLLQLAGLAAGLIVFALPVSDSWELLFSLSILAVLPIVHHLLFRFYVYTASEQVKTSPDALFSVWWGAGTTYPVSLSFFRRAEATVTLGSVLTSAFLFAWLPFSYGVTLAIGSVVFIIPRLSALLLTYRQPGHCRVRYEQGSIAFLQTDG